MGFIQIAKNRTNYIKKEYDIAISVSKANTSNKVHTHVTLNFFFSKEIMKLMQWNIKDEIAIYYDENKSYRILLRNIYDGSGYRIGKYIKEGQGILSVQVEPEKLELPRRMTRRALMWEKFEDGILINTKEFV